jgi:hypothetical protein
MVQMWRWFSADAARASRWKRSSACGIGSSAVGQELDRDVPAQAHVLGSVDDAHAARAELSRQTIVRDCPATTVKAEARIHLEG